MLLGAIPHNSREETTDTAYGGLNLIEPISHNCAMRIKHHNCAMRI